jgi:hypothetical protein
MAVLSALKGPNAGDGTGSFALIQKSVTPASVAANTTAPQNIAMDAGDAKIGDMFFFVQGAQQAGVGVTMVNAIATADTLPVVFINNTAGPLVPTAGLYTFLRIRQ